MSSIRWLRVVIAAFLIELGLVVTTVPFLLLIGDRVFATAVPVACLVVPFVVAWLATRKLPAQRLLHGVSIGAVATLMYFVLVIGTGSVAEAVASYGFPLFIVVNALRLLSAAAGGYAAERSATPVGA
jgi:hypothetical protein